MSVRETRRTPTDITIPDFCLVVLIGASGAGKSTFAAKHFKPTELISSDWARGAVSDDENDQTASNAAFELVHFMVSKRLQGRRLTVVDATNVRPEDRREYVRLARKYHALPVAIVINPPEDICHERNAERSNRQFGPHVVRNHVRALKRGIRGLQKEGFRQVYEYCSVADIDSVTIARTPLWTDRRAEAGPFDVIGDVHGCCDELEVLLDKLGYSVRISSNGDERTCKVTPPEGRRAIFVGDLVDRGPRSPDVLRLVMQMVEDGTALCVNGNHDDKFRRYLEGRNVKTTHGLDKTIAQMEGEGETFRRKVKDFLGGLISHYWLDGGALAVAHAGLSEEMFGRASGQIRAFAMYGDTTGETDEFGLPVRYNWAADYRGKTAIIYGHTPIPEAEWLNRTLCVDTGCVFGGKLTALRWPERELVSVPANEFYAEPARPLGYQAGGDRSNQAIVDDMLDLDDVRGKRIIESRLFNTVTISEAHSAAALEAMSRFAMNPKWLVYLPPTMSPSETSDKDGFLEHPAEAFAYFRNNSVGTVVCEEKHMGSRAVIIVCRDNETARRRFGIAEDGLTGTIHTRTGRVFFNDASVSEMLLARLRSAMDACDFWGRFETDWAVLDAELMPWSAKARSLLLEQYAPVGAAATLSADATRTMFEAASRRGVDIGDALTAAQLKQKQAADYVRAWQHYCWDVKTLDDYRIAPFHLLATEGAMHMDKNHVWHMEELATLAASDDPVIMATPFRTVELGDEKAVAEATDWWLDMTGKGGEGMVVKPLDFITRGKRGLVQPALKCRGRDYLRIIYGPEYDTDTNLARLRKRGLAAKRGLASREFALGYEALNRFVECEPLRRVHECTFGVLALESEPVDPRL